MSTTTPSFPHRAEPGRSLMILILVACAVALAGVLASPDRAWVGILIGFQFLVGMALAGLLFVAIARLSKARWATPLLPLCDGLSRSLPVAAVLGLLLFLGIPTLYEWSHADVVAEDKLLQHKSAWLNVPFFCLRTVGYFLVWMFLARRLVGSRVAPHQAPLDDARQLRHSALFMALFGITFSFASVDWVQSLQPHWFSTIFALRTTSGLVLAGLAGLTLFAVRRWPEGCANRPNAVFPDLGKLMLTMSVVWVYMWFCQYMLIWYSNIPEETSYYVARQGTGWGTLTVVNLVLNWGVPFMVLLLRHARSNPLVLTRIAWVLLIGRLVDLYLEVGPPVFQHQIKDAGPRIDFWQVSAVVAAVAAFFLITRRALDRPPTVTRVLPTQVPPALDTQTAT